MHACSLQYNYIILLLLSYLAAARRPTETAKQGAGTDTGSEIKEAE